MDRKLGTVIGLLALCFLLTAGVTGCHSGSSPAGQGSESRSSAGGSSDDSGSNAGGLGMTYTGKVGINLGGRLVAPISGGTPQLGMGF